MREQNQHYQKKKKSKPRNILAAAMNTPRKNVLHMDRNVQKVKKMNHYSTVCKSIQEIRDIPPSDGSDYQIDSFTIIGEDKERTWKVTLDINGTKTPFKIDTGADVTVISPAT